MAHRLPRAGIKSEDSEHFAFCHVIPPCRPPRRDDECIIKPDACLLRPKFVALTSGNNHDRRDHCNDINGQQCFQISCCCDDNLGKCIRNPVRSIGHHKPDACRSEMGNLLDSRHPGYQKIIVIQPPETMGVEEKRWSSNPECRVPYMRRREVPIHQEDVIYSNPKLVELVCSPKNKDPHETNSSMAVNVDSVQGFYRLSQPEVLRTYVPIVSRDCRRRVPDFRKRKTLFQNH